MRAKRASHSRRDKEGMVHFFDSREESLRCLGQDRRRIESHRAPHLYGNGARCPSLKVCRNRLLKGDHNRGSIFAVDGGAASTGGSASARNSGSQALHDGRQVALPRDDRARELNLSGAASEITSKKSQTRAYCPSPS